MISSPIVGMHFRPPAKAIVAHLPLDTELELRPDPENPYSTTGKAVKVFVDMNDLPETFWAAAESDLAGMGGEREELEIEPIMLGFVAEAKNHEAQKAIFDLIEKSPYTAIFSRDPAGKPIVIVRPD
jgi:hypothetical protein